MADTANANEKKKKPSFFKGLRKEFKKITWPSSKDATKQTAVVLVVTVLLGAFIALIDMVILEGVNILTSF